MVQKNGSPEQRRRVVLYCRASTSDQDNDRQERDLGEYAERAGFEIVGVFKETLSGIRKAKGKQLIERKKVMALAQARQMNRLWRWSEVARWAGEISESEMAHARVVAATNAALELRSLNPDDGERLIALSQ